MTSQAVADRPPPLLRFLDSFLQERNIKWLLVLGILILLGSSVMLVADHWNNYTPSWKYLIMLAYTGLIFTAGQWSYHKLALRRTGTLLMALTVLLLPALFLALHWIQAPQTATSAELLHLPLLGLTLVFSLVAAGRIFSHFLRGPQPTFLAAYLILCVSGTLAPALPQAAAPWASLALWAVFAAGAVKVNRHVFWLSEEQQAARIFGFFPIALLGGLFLTLFTLNFAQAIALEWFGLGCALVAVPVLLTADTVARVYQQRTGGLIERHPAAVILPLLLGVVLCAGGIALSGAGLMPGHSPLAITPTAALAAMMMALTARRTGKTAFVWMALLAATLAYNFAPFFFQDLARQFIASGAAAVREETLPYAFYGLTYLPLIAALGGASLYARRRGNQLFADPLRNYSIILSCLLLAASLGHPKAMFPVALAMLAVFSLQTAVYRQRLLALPALLAGLIAAYALAPFCTGVLGLPLWPTATTLSLTGMAALLSLAGGQLDARLAQLPCPEFKAIDSRLFGSLCQQAGLVLSLALAGRWFVLDLMLHPAALTLAHTLPPVLIAALLVTHALRRQNGLLGAAAIVFIQANAVVLMIALGLDPAEVTALATLLLLGQWGLRYLFALAPRSRAALTFARAGDLVSAYGLLVVFLLVYLPLSAFNLVFGAWLQELHPWWICRVLVIAWLFDAARNYRLPLVAGPLAVLGCFGTLLLAGAALVIQLDDYAWRWLPLLWTGLALAALPIAQGLHRRLSNLEDPVEKNHGRALAYSIDGVALVVFCGAALLSLCLYTLPVVGAGLAASTGLITLALLRRWPTLRVSCLVLVNWQFIALTVALSASERLLSLFVLDSSVALPASLPIALASVVSLILWARLPSTAASGTIAAVQQILLRLCGLIALLASLQLDTLSAGQILMAALTFALLVGRQLYNACRQRQEWRVWAAECIAVAALAYFAWHGVVRFGGGYSMFIVLGLSLVCWVVSRWAARRTELSVLVRPLHLSAQAMPLLSVGLALYRHNVLPDPAWLGQNSLALLLAAGFYFWLGLEGRKRVFLVAAAVIANLALALLWRELSWTDPQFYLVPVGATVLFLVHLLRAQIPVRLHNPLYYLGALTILVSPLFHIAGGSWVHLFSLMLASTLMVLLAIGLRIRALVYTGAAFLIADLLAMIARGSIDNPNLLWIAGLLLGAAVVVLGATAERNRELLLQRLRSVSATLETWN